MNTDQDAKTPLKNIRYERFCHAYTGKAAGNGAKAFVMAGFTAANPKVASAGATRMLAKDSICKRIAYIRTGKDEKICLTREEFLKMLSYAATKADRWSDRLKALELLAKAQGYNEPSKIEVAAVQKVDMSKFSDEQLKMLVEHVESISSP